RNEVTLLVVAHQRLENERRGLDVLGAARQIGRQDRRRLPVDDLDLAIGAARGIGAGSERGCRDRTNKKRSERFHLQSPIIVYPSGKAVRTWPMIFEFLPRRADRISAQVSFL